MRTTARSFVIRAVGAAALGALLPFAPASASVKDLGGGWEVQSGNDELLDAVTDFVSLSANVLVIEKFAEFYGLDDSTDLPYPLDLTFRQNAPDAQTVTRIVITDEVVFNNSSLTWTAFSMKLLGASGGPSTVATFNQAQSASFSFEPFTSRAYSAGSTRVDFTGGTIAGGAFWTPGLRAGGLVIQADLSDRLPAEFTLRELPVPGPGATALLALAGLIGSRRRR
ncbi:MAG: hypothetical protein JNM07_12575 [Phycisphaerae bacterium]|nr:hypothetical protein [Phycisphaerae bacterium]